ncbi:hypothetical protein RJ640_008213 [Escallonia rubra]|uniref:DNA-directed DNA polymerase n=1 Tax=Escallonia rubra TaxID=112253 RepID=A0AA88QNJ3_9ASTE|nr:hypothetical protein RJ640_008213 [Escallonia rubra]
MAEHGEGYPCVARIAQAFFLGNKPELMDQDDWEELQVKAVSTIRLNLAPKVKYQLRMDEGPDLGDHIFEFNRLVSQLSSIDVKLEEEAQAILLLSSLPKSYETLKTMLLIKKETLLVNDAMSALLDSSKVNGIGAIKIKMFDGIVRTLGDVRYIPDLKKNLISLGTLDSIDCSISLKSGVMKVSKGAMVIMKGQKTENLYKLVGNTVIGGVSVSTHAGSSNDNSELWHKRLGHLSEGSMLELHKRKLLQGVKSCKLDFCKFCVFGKQKRVSFKAASHTKLDELRTKSADESTDGSTDEQSLEDLDEHPSDSWNLVKDREPCTKKPNQSRMLVTSITRQFNAFRSVLTNSEMLLLLQMSGIEYLMSLLKLQRAYERSEDPIYVLENNIPIDPQYYLENQISKIGHSVHTARVEKQNSTAEQLAMSGWELNESRYGRYSPDQVNSPEKSHELIEESFQNLSSVEVESKKLHSNCHNRRTCIVGANVAAAHANAVVAADQGPSQTVNIEPNRVQMRKLPEVPEHQSQPVKVGGVKVDTVPFSQGTRKFVSLSTLQTATQKSDRLRKCAELKAAAKEKFGRKNQAEVESAAVDKAVAAKDKAAKGEAAKGKAAR